MTDEPTARDADVPLDEDRVRTVLADELPSRLVQSRESLFGLDEFLAMSRVPRKRSELESAALACAVWVSPNWIFKRIGSSGEIRFEVPRKLDSPDERKFRIIDGAPIPARAILRSIWPRAVRSYVHFLPYSGAAMPDDPSALNLFVGFPARPVHDPALAARVFEFVGRVWGRSCTEHTTYLLDWFAYLVQRPAEKHRSRLVVHASREDVRAMLIAFVGLKLVGPSAFTVVHRVKQVQGADDHVVEARKLVVVDQTSYPAEWRAISDINFGRVVKYRATTTRRKGFVPLETKVLASFIILPPLSADVGPPPSAHYAPAIRLDDRELSDDYLEEMRGIFADPRTAPAVMDELLRRPLPSFWWHDVMPDAEAREE